MSVQICEPPPTVPIFFLMKVFYTHRLSLYIHSPHTLSKYKMLPATKQLNSVFCRRLIITEYTSMKGVYHNELVNSGQIGDPLLILQSTLFHKNLLLTIE